MSSIPLQDTGGNQLFLPSNSNISDISLISLYWSEILGKPSFCNVAITGNYNDLINLPTSSVVFSGDYNNLSNLSWINSNSNIYFIKNGNVGIGTSNPNNKLHLIGNFSIEGNIIPNINSNFNLGSSNLKWRDIYLSGNSIFLDNLILSKNNFDNLEIKDSNGNLKNLNLNAIELNNLNDKVILSLSNQQLIFNSNGTIYNSINFNNYSNIVYSNILLNTSNNIIRYINSNIINNSSININTDTINIGSSNRFITSNIYSNNLTVTSNLFINGNYYLKNQLLPFSINSNTSIITSNGLFSYINNCNFGYYTFLTNGSITFPQTTNCDILVVGAGGNGGIGPLSGGGGAGEIISYPNYSFNNGTYNIRIGTSSFNSNTKISSITSNNISILAQGGGDGASIYSYNNSINTNITLTNNSILEIPMINSLSNISSSNYNVNINQGLISINGLTNNFSFYNTNLYPIIYNTNNSIINPYLWYKFENNLNDSGTAGKNLSVSRGSASYNNSIFYKGSNSAYFDNNTYFENSTISLAVPITLSLWLYVINKSAMHTALALTVGSTVAINLDIEHFDANYCTPNVVVALNTQWLQPVPKINVLYNTWHNYIITIGVDSGGTNAVMRFYFNGLLVTALTGTSPNFNVNPTRIIVGTNGETQTRSFIGYINDLRIYTTALNYSQVLRLYNDSLVYYNRPYPTLLDNNSNIINPYLWYKFENNLNDSGTATKNLSVSRSSISYNQTILYRGSQSIYFNNSAYLENTSISLAVPMTLSLWFYPLNKNGDQTILALNVGGTVAFNLDVNHIDTFFCRACVVVALNVQWLYENDGQIPRIRAEYNKWHNYTVTIGLENDVNAVMRFYFNGILITTLTGTSPNFNVNPTRIIVGTNGDGFSRNFIGYISDLRIYRFALTYQQVLNLYNTNINIYTSANNNAGGLSSSYSNIYSNNSIINNTWNNLYSYFNRGSNGTFDKGGNGGSALSNIGLSSFITGNNLIVGEGGTGDNGFLNKIFQANSTITLTRNAFATFNYTNTSNINAGTYTINFNNGAITLTGITTDRSYPLLRNNLNNIINPLLWYKFDDNLSSLVNDASGNGYTLTNNTVLFNTTNFTKGNGSASFDGSGDNLVVTNLNLNNKSFSISVWCYLTDNTKICGIFGVKTPGSNGATRNVMHICYIPPQFGIGIYFNLFGDDTNFTGITTTTETNNWRHYVFILNNDINPKTLAIYRDGILVRTKNLGGSYSAFTNTYTVGQIFDDATRTWAGQLDDFRIYDRVISDQEVLELYNGRVLIYSFPDNNNSNIISVPRLDQTYGSGGDGNGGLGTQGIIIIRTPLDVIKSQFDGYINYSNIVNRPIFNDIISTNNYINIGFNNQVNFPLADVAWANEWFLYIGTSPISSPNSFIFWHLTSNINSKWWFNGTIATTNAEISDNRIKKEITNIENPIDKLMALQPKEYYLCDEKDYLKKYGILAQDVYSNQDLKHLVYQDEEYIANIYTNAIYNNKIITTEISIIDKIEINDEIKILIDNNENKEIIIEDLPYYNRYKKRYIKIKEIINDYSFEIYEEIEIMENEKNKIFIYGKKVNDFLKLDYSSLYSLNIAYTQEIYKIIQKNKQLLHDLDNDLTIIENKI